MLSNHSILVTGGAGYLGSVIIPQLLAEGHAVTVLDSFIFRQNSLMDCCQYEQFKIVRGDCRDESIVKPLLAKGAVSVDLDFVEKRPALPGIS